MSDPTINEANGLLAFLNVREAGRGAGIHQHHANFYPESLGQHSFIHFGLTGGGGAMLDLHSESLLARFVDSK